MMRKLNLLASHSRNWLVDDRYRRFFAQRAVKKVSAREAMARRTAQRLPKAAAQGADAAAVASLRTEGFALVPGMIPDAWVRDLRDYFTDRPVRDNYHPKGPLFRAPSEAPPGVHVAFYTNEEVANAPHALEIANHPALLATVSAEMGVKPLIAYLAAWWSLPAGDGIAQHAEKFHRDVDDSDWTKFFLYLTDVDEDSGPHVFVRGSHRDDRLTDKIRRFSDEEVAETFGADRQVRFTGPAGTALLEKTYGVHRGIPARSKPRLMFQVVYSMTPLIYGPKKPVVDLPAGYDRHSNQVYCRT